ncbi:MAG: inositol monophosphatase [Deltaproteobacteria bacterium]|nr:inositol monophosphatase [Deltaproteobacteria bacterium]
MREWLNLRDTALAVAREVSEIPAAAQPRTLAARTLATSTKSSELDLVTELDQATERAIVRALVARRPHDGLLGEEGAASPSTSGYTWVVDPIDGTVNYFYGLGQWAISLGVVDAAGVPVAGVVHAPALGETFVAARGFGAHLLLGEEWHPLAPPPDVPLELALLATGFSYDRERRRQMGAVFADLVPRIRDFRRMGSAALDICAVAAGRINGFYERDLKPWDRIGAQVIATEVGLTVHFVGAMQGHNLTVVAPPRLAGILQAELARLGVVD